MTQSIDERIAYHPDPRVSGVSDRKVTARLNLLLNEVDFHDKVILDLGCSGGYFSFQLAKVARKVIAVDGDKEVIERNKSLQVELGISNIEFICAPITEGLIDAVGAVDVVLFLSVFHHMLTGSDAYDWNTEMHTNSHLGLFYKISQHSSRLVFEMGEVDEGYEWCERMPPEAADIQLYVNEVLLNGRFNRVSMYDSPIKQAALRNYLFSALSKKYTRDSLLASRVKGLLKYDSRDKRKIFIAEV